MEPTFSTTTLSVRFLDTLLLADSADHAPHPPVDAKVSAEWNVPDSWELTAQLVFGKKESEAAAKDFAPLEDRVKVFGAKI